VGRTQRLFAPSVMLMTWLASRPSGTWAEHRVGPGADGPDLRPHGAQQRVRASKPDAGGRCMMGVRSLLCQRHHREDDGGDCRCYNTSRHLARPFRQSAAPCPLYAAPAPRRPPPLIYVSYYIYMLARRDRVHAAR
jgi:hypothetical protein